MYYIIKYKYISITRLVRIILGLSIFLSKVLSKIYARLLPFNKPVK